MKISFPCCFFVTIIYLYQKLLSPFSKGCCRFYPSCSEYAIASVRRYGVLRGCFLILLRILRCHPFSSGGYDPIPSQFTFLLYQQEHQKYHGR